MSVDRKLLIEWAGCILPLGSDAFFQSPSSLSLDGLGYDVLDYFVGDAKSLLGAISQRLPYSAMAVRRADGTAHYFNRGTRAWEEWARDGEAVHIQAPYLPQGMLCHAGFDSITETLVNPEGLSPSEVFAKRGLKPSCKGHSLGGPMAKTVAIKSNLVGIQHYLFEAPRMFSPAAAAYVRSLGFLFGATFMPGDIVPTLPPASFGWSHDDLSDELELSPDGLRDTLQARHTMTSILHSLDNSFPAAPEDAAPTQPLTGQVNGAS